MMVVWFYGDDDNDDFIGGVLAGAPSSEMMMIAVDDNENTDAKKVIPNGVGARTERFYEGKLGHHHNDVDLCRNCF